MQVGVGGFHSGSQELFPGGRFESGPISHLQQDLPWPPGEFSPPPVEGEGTCRNDPVGRQGQRSQAPRHLSARPVPSHRRDTPCDLGHTAWDSSAAVTGGPFPSTKQVVSVNHEQVYFHLNPLQNGFGNTGAIK